jgi:hypothetical protein
MTPTEFALTAARGTKYAPKSITIANNTEYDPSVLHNVDGYKYKLARQRREDGVVIATFRRLKNQ